MPGYERGRRRITTTTTTGTGGPIQLPDERQVDALVLSHRQSERAGSERKNVSAGFTGFAAESCDLGAKIWLVSYMGSDHTRLFRFTSLHNQPPPLGGCGVPGCGVEGCLYNLKIAAFEHCQERDLTNIIQRTANSRIQFPAGQMLRRRSQMASRPTASRKSRQPTGVNETTRGQRDYQTSTRLPGVNEPTRRQEDPRNPVKQLAFLGYNS
ncbi:hypothetical protein B0T22DRAFT_253142 [Podospora appendiculata]|uniref:Uncharacterized protein n=1 Tax=Podospora appendiculata TaxID=314037 RepID=A0AAE0X341_9PEZI|nr:hypothetical protein B0T22DRAFT_253142 [Podospora appendiculata]